GAADAPLLQYQLPKVAANGAVTRVNEQPAPEYKPLDAAATVDVLAEPGVVQITLPGADELRLWTDLDPLEPGVGDLPPALEDSTLGQRLITWLRVTAPARARAPLLWVGINATAVTQRALVAN